MYTINDYLAPMLGASIICALPPPTAARPTWLAPSSKVTFRVIELAVDVTVAVNVTEPPATCFDG